MPSIFASIGNNDKARAHFLDALKKCDVNTDKEIVFKVRHNYAQFLSGIQDHASAGEYYELAADILRNNPAEQAKFALESYLGGLNYSIAAKYEALQSYAQPGTVGLCTDVAGQTGQICRRLHCIVP
ncbi:hypothetical protein NXW94_06555 [Bacteroides ovatus]|nr:hypothetical protein [Bacteroides ovatus]